MGLYKHILSSDDGSFYFLFMEFKEEIKMNEKLEVVIPDLLYRYKNVLIRYTGDYYIFMISTVGFKLLDLDTVIGVIEELL